MKLVTYRIKTALGTFDRIGAIQGDLVVDLNLACEALLAANGSTELAAKLAAIYIPSSMVAFLEGGSVAMQMAHQSFAFAIEHREAQDDIGKRWAFTQSEIKLLAPVLQPPSLRDFCCFETHAMNAVRINKASDAAKASFYEFPAHYKGNPRSIIGPEEQVRWPYNSTNMDYELEFAVVIGKQGVNIKEADADKYIAGYTILNDFSARDMMRKEGICGMGPAKGKSFDTGTAFGPWLVTPG